MVSLPEPPSPSRPDSLRPSGPDQESAWKPRSALIGTLLANRYRVVSLVGQGSTGAVYRADDVLHHRPVAIRVLVPALAQQPGLVSRIRARIEANARLDQEPLVNLVDITDVGMTLEGELFVVSDFLDGDHLASMLARGGRLPWSRARSLVVRLGQILQDFHKLGIVVGTLESRLCFAVRGKAKQESIKIVHNAVLQHVAAHIGPGADHAAAVLARYVAPEQACGEPIDARADVYSLGVVAFELLTGTVPFADANPVRVVAMHLQKPAPSPRDVAPDAGIPREVEAVLLKCLAKDPSARYADMQALTDALSAIPENATDVVSPTAATLVATVPTHAVAAAAATAAAVAPIAASEPAAPTPAPASESAPAPAAAPAPATSRPATLPPVLGATIEGGKLRLPPPPSLDRPPTIAPKGMTLSGLPRLPSLGRPPTISPSAGLRPPSVPVAAAAPVPSATLPGPIAATPTADAQAPTTGPSLAAAAAVAAAQTTAATPAAVVPGPTAPTPSVVLPASAVVSGPIPSAAAAEMELAPRPVSPAVSEPATPSLADLAPAPRDVPAPVPADTSAAPVLSTSEPVPADSLDADGGKVTDSARIRNRISAFAAEEARRGPTSKAPTRAAPHSAPAAPAATAAPTTPEPAKPVAEPAKPVAEPVVVKQPEPEPPRLQVVHSAPRVAEPSLVPTDSILQELPRRRNGWLVGGIVTLVAAAGIAALVFTSPSFMNQSSKPNPTKTAAKDTPAPAKTVPTKIAQSDPPVLPERGTSVVDTPPPADTTPPADTPPPTDAPSTGTPPVEALTPPPETPPATPTATPTPTSKKKDTKKKRRRDPVEEDHEPDVFDQLREHMAAKKAAEAARASGAQTAPTPTPTPTPTPADTKSDADKARETLDRARQASNSGNPSLAYTLAKQSYNLNRTQEALELMGVSACKAKNTDNARSALSSLTGSRRSTVVAACSASGITL